LVSDCRFFSISAFRLRLRFDVSFTFDERAK
jgi:hypothetical protein